MVFEFANIWCHCIGNFQCQFIDAFYQEKKVKKLFGMASFIVMNLQLPHVIKFTLKQSKAMQINK